MSESFVVPARYCGPPESGNGGWVSGHLAQLVPTTEEEPAVTVRLSSPPPLDRAMALRRTATAVEVRDGEVLVAAGQRAAPLDPAVAPGPVSFAAAQEAGAGYPGLHDHPFPTCFSCGTARDDDEALHLRPGELDGHRGVFAASWLPGPATTPEVVWAALDCPGAWALGVGGRPMVLGTMTAQLYGMPEAGQEHVVMAWGTGGAGRKHHCGTALYAADGRLLAQAAAVWLTIDPATVRPATAVAS